MIFVGIGANLESDAYGAPIRACEAVVRALENLEGVALVGCSNWYESEPVPKSDQPWYVNGVAKLDSKLLPDELLEALHQIEKDFGRVRTVPNAARVIDLDLLDYNGAVKEGGVAQLPHPRMTTRAFVMLPLRDLAPDWICPVTGEGICQIIKALPPDQVCRPISTVP